MKPSGILIHTERGDVIDERALIAALKNHTIFASGLDVYIDGPKVRADLANLENVVLLPHLGSAIYETRVAMDMHPLANLDAVREGRPQPDWVAGTVHGGLNRK